MWQPIKQKSQQVSAGFFVGYLLISPLFNIIEIISNMKMKNKITFIFVFFCFVYTVYISLPSYFLWVTGKKAKAEILSIQKNQDEYEIEFSYHNENDNIDYLAVKNLDNYQYEKIKNLQVIIIRYPKFYLEHLHIVGVDYRSTVYFQLIFHIIGLFTLLKLLKKSIINIKKN